MLEGDPISHQSESMEDVDFVWLKRIDAIFSATREASEEDGNPPSNLKNELDDFAQILPDYIDHTCLKPEATEADIDKLCAEAKKWDFHVSV